MPREMAVEPMPQQATGESAPKSWKFAALSPGVETAGAARDGCRAGAPASHGGKCTKIAEIPGAFPGGWRRQVPREMAVESMPQQATGESAPESRVWGTLSTGDPKDAHWTFSNEKRLAALGSRGRGPPRSGGRAWSFRLLNVHAAHRLRRRWG